MFNILKKPLYSPIKIYDDDTEDEVLSDRDDVSDYDDDKIYSIVLNRITPTDHRIRGCYSVYLTEQKIPGPLCKFITPIMNHEIYGYNGSEMKLFGIKIDISNKDNSESFIYHSYENKISYVQDSEDVSILLQFLNKNNYDIKNKNSVIECLKNGNEPDIDIVYKNNKFEDTNNNSSSLSYDDISINTTTEIVIYKNNKVSPEEKNYNISRCVGRYFFKSKPQGVLAEYCAFGGVMYIKDDYTFDKVYIITYGDNGCMNDTKYRLFKRFIKQVGFKILYDTEINGMKTDKNGDEIVLIIK